MRYNNFEKYQNHYVEGAKKVTVKTFRHNAANDIAKPEVRLHDFFIVFFNDKGRLLWLYIKFEKTDWRKHLFLYDSKGHINRVIITDMNNKFDEQYDYTYYEDGRLRTEIVSTFGNEALSLVSEEQINYEANNKRITRTDYSFDPERTWIFNSKYSEDGKLLEEKIEEAEVELLVWTKYEYCKYGYVIEKELDDNGSKRKEVKYKNVECQYVYNENNHWIKEFYNQTEGACFTTEREIEYFE